MNPHLEIMTVFIKEIGLCRKISIRWSNKSTVFKRHGRLNKNSDLTLDKEKPVVEEHSDSSIGKIIPNDDNDSNNIVEQCSSSAGGQHKCNHIGSDKTGLNLDILVVQKIGPSRPLRSFWINTRRCLNKNKAINRKANEEGVLHHQDQESIIGHLIGFHHLFRRCMYHGLHIQVCLILCFHIMTNRLMLYQVTMIWIIGCIGRFKIFVIEHAKSMKAKIFCWS